MALDAEFQELMDRWKAGDESAAVAVFQRYASRLIARARAHLGAKLRQKVDPEDVLQSVYKSFLKGHAAGRLVPENWEHLWALLVTITDRKCYGRFDYFKSKSHDVDREVGDERVLAREPTPDEAVMLADLVEALLRAFDQEGREALSLHLQGFSVAEIEAQTGRSARTIFRVLERARGRLKRLIGQAGI